MKENVTQLLRAAAGGDSRAAGVVMDLVYDELRRRAGHLMQAERANHTLQPTALVHEAFLQIVRQERVDWRSRSHFMSVAGMMMRRILVDHARRKQAAARGGGVPALSLEEGLGLSVDNPTDVLELHQALERLEVRSPRQAQVVLLRFFVGMTVPEVAAALALSTRSVEADWTVAKAWLRRELTDGR